jgi:hypothetical protein
MTIETFACLRAGLHACLALFVSSSAATAATATFDDLGLPTNTRVNGSTLTPYTTGSAFGEAENWNRFESGGISFENRFIPSFGSWSRWAYSNQTDNTTQGFTNDVSAFAGGGADLVTGSTIIGNAYGIAFKGSDKPAIALPPGLKRPVSAMFANTTFAALTMRNGDGFSKKFGGADGTDPDFFLLSILGENPDGTITGSVDFYLADYRADDSSADFIHEGWMEVDLTPLGNDVATMRFEFSSSDVGAFGINTPQYFAMDNLVVVPEPSSMFFLASGLLILLWLSRKCPAKSMACVFGGAVGFAGMVGEGRAEGIPADDPRIVNWATGVVDVQRGPVNISDQLRGFASFGNPLSALGPVDVWALDQEDAPVVSLGDGGQITLTFDPPIANGPGEDLAVFENGFNEQFLELAFVEASSDGVNFVRFPATALHQVSEQIGPFGTVNPSGLRNLAGAYPAGIGVGFELDDIGLNDVTHVRIIDAVGSITDGFGSPDSEGVLINDPWPTPFASGGFDLDAVAVLNQRIDTPAPTDPVSFEDWTEENFSDEALADAAISGEKADPDADGLTNLEEYAHWLNPLLHSEPPALDIRLARDLGFAEILMPDLPMFREDVRYKLESTETLKDWRESEDGSPLAVGDRYFRLRIERDLAPAASSTGE